MGIVAVDAGLTDGAIGIDGLEVRMVADFHGPGDRPFRVFTKNLQTLLFQLAVRRVMRVNGPETDEPVTDFGAGLRGEFARLEQELSRQGEQIFFCAPVFSGFRSASLLEAFN